MSEFLAIVADTWRQSRAQVVYIIMMVVLVLVALAAAILPTIKKHQSGEDSLGLMWMSGPLEVEDMWAGLYAQSLARNAGERINMFEQPQKSQADNEESMNRFIKEARERAKTIPRLNRAVEIYVYGVSNIIFSIAMLLFIGACAGYFPDLLAAGAIDVVISKPISRLKIMLGKYLGGLILFSMLMLGVYLILFVGIGIRTGVWNWRVVMPGPLTLFSAAVLFAVISVYGIMWRSTSLCIVIGYVFYIVIDTIIGAFLSLYMSGMFAKSPTMEKTCSLVRTTMPNFGLMKEVAVASVLNMPSVDWGPMATAACWLVGSLALAYYLLRRKDF